MLRRAEIDIAITYDMEIPKDVSFEGLAKLPPYVMVSADHPLAHQGSVSLEQMHDEPLVLLDLPMSRDYFLSMFYNKGLRPKIADRTPHTSVVRSLVANGAGYSLINARTRTDMAPDGRKLAYLPLTGEHRPVKVGLATMRVERKSRILKAFEDHARGQITTNHVPGMANSD